MLTRMGIKGRVLLLTLLPTSLMASLLGGYFTWMQLSELQTQLLQRGEMIAEQLAPLVAPALSARNTELLERDADDFSLQLFGEPLHAGVDRTLRSLDLRTPLRATQPRNDVPEQCAKTHRSTPSMMAS